MSKPRVLRRYGVYTFGHMNRLLSNDDKEFLLGNFVTTTHCVDADLLYDIMTGRHLNGIMETATLGHEMTTSVMTVAAPNFGSEQMTTGTCVNRNTHGEYQSIVDGFIQWSEPVGRFENNTAATASFGYIQGHQVTQLWIILIYGRSLIGNWYSKKMTTFTPK